MKQTKSKYRVYWFQSSGVKIESISIRQLLSEYSNEFFCINISKQLDGYIGIKLDTNNEILGFNKFEKRLSTIFSTHFEINPRPQSDRGLIRIFKRHIYSRIKEKGEAQQIMDDTISTNIDKFRSIEATIFPSQLGLNNFSSFEDHLILLKKIKKSSRKLSQNQKCKLSIDEIIENFKKLRIDILVEMYCLTIPDEDLRIDHVDQLASIFVKEVLATDRKPVLLPTLFSLSTSLTNIEKSWNIEGSPENEFKVLLLSTFEKLMKKLQSVTSTNCKKDISESVLSNPRSVKRDSKKGINIEFLIKEWIQDCGEIYSYNQSDRTWLKRKDPRYPIYTVIPEVVIKKDIFYWGEGKGIFLDVKVITVLIKQLQLTLQRKENDDILCFQNGIYQYKTKEFYSYENDYAKRFVAKNMVPLDFLPGMNSEVPTIWSDFLKKSFNSDSLGNVKRALNLTQNQANELVKYLQQISSADRVEDPIGILITQHLEFDSGFHETNQNLYAKFEMICKDIGVQTVSKNRFLTDLIQQVGLRLVVHVERKKILNSRGISGLRLKEVNLLEDLVPKDEVIVTSEKQSIT